MLTASKQKKALFKVLQAEENLRIKTIINFAQKEDKQSCPIIVLLEIMVNIPLEEEEQSHEWIREQLGGPEKVLQQVLDKL